MNRGTVVAWNGAVADPGQEVARRHGPGATPDRACDCTRDPSRHRRRAAEAAPADSEYVGAGGPEDLQADRRAAGRGAPGDLDRRVPVLLAVGHAARTLRPPCPASRRR